jgi:hypothetical protein
MAAAEDDVEQVALEGVVGRQQADVLHDEDQESVPPLEGDLPAGELDGLERCLRKARLGGGRDEIEGHGNLHSLVGDQCLHGAKGVEGGEQRCCSRRSCRVTQERLGFLDGWTQVEGERCELGLESVLHEAPYPSDHDRGPMLRVVQLRLGLVQAQLPVGRDGRLGDRLEDAGPGDRRDAQAE